MVKSGLEKYCVKILDPYDWINEDIWAPLLRIRNDGDFGEQIFHLSWNPITNPTTISVNHAHDFDQYLIFTGGDGTNMPDLGGVVELILSKDGINKEVITITEATCVRVPPAMYHCPVYFKKINDPKKPIIFQMLYFKTADEYKMIFKDPEAEKESKRQLEKEEMMRQKLRKEKGGNT